MNLFRKIIVKWLELSSNKRVSRNFKYERYNQKSKQNIFKNIQDSINSFRAFNFFNSIIIRILNKSNRVTFNDLTCMHS